MKRILSLILALCLCAAAGTALAELKGTYSWKDMTVEVTEAEEGGMFAPADMTDNEYCVSLHYTVPTDLAADSDGMHELYISMLLQDIEGNTYAPGARLSNDTEQTNLYAVPKGIGLEHLTLVISVAEGEETASTGEAPQAEPGAAVEITLDSGDVLKLTPIEASAFANQGDNVSVKTRIGPTNHKSGSTFLAGSQLGLGTMRNTRQYDLPRVVFTYDTALDKDAAADAIGAIGAGATLTVNGQTYSPILAWITDQMACYIFDCDALPEGLPGFALQDGKLFIQY